MQYVMNTEKWFKKRGRLVTPSLTYVSSDKILFIVMLQNQKIDESFTCTTFYILVFFLFFFKFLINDLTTDIKIIVHCGNSAAELKEV